MVDGSILDSHVKYSYPFSPGAVDISAISVDQSFEDDGKFVLYCDAHRVTDLRHWQETSAWLRIRHRRRTFCRNHLHGRQLLLRRQTRCCRCVIQVHEACHRYRDRLIAVCQPRNLKSCSGQSRLTRRLDPGQVRYDSIVIAST